MLFDFLGLLQKQGSLFEFINNYVHVIVSALIPSNNQSHLQVLFGTF